MSQATLNRIEDGGLEGFRSVRRNGPNWGQRNANAAYDARVVEAARFMADVMDGSTPSWAIKEAIAPTSPQALQMIRSYYPLLVREGQSVSDFPLLTGDVLDRMMIAAYREQTGAWRQYIKVGRPLRDFRNVRRIKVDGGDGKWDKLTEEGGLKYTSIDETGYTYAPDLYGKGMRLSFRAIMNDDLGAFEEIPNILGRGGRRTVARFGTGLLFDANGPHASIVSGGNGNLLTGNPAFSIAALGTALAQIKGFKDSEGEPIATESLRLVFGPALTVDVNNVLNQLTVDVAASGPGGATGQTIRVNNWIVRNLTPVEDPYLPIIATANPSSWALVADPNMGRAAAEMGFLAGFAEPQLYRKASNTATIAGGIDQNAGDFHSMTQDYKGVIGYGGTRMEPKSIVGSNGSGS